MKAVVSGVDVYRWIEDGQTLEAYRGDEIDVSQDEFTRSPGALSKPGSGTDGSSGGYPTVQEALDALADAHNHSFPQHVRTVQEKIKDLVDNNIDPDAPAPKRESAPKTKTEPPPAAEFPGTHAELDALADANKVTWPDPAEGKTKLTVAEKHAALLKAGVKPSAPAE